MASQALLLASLIRRRPSWWTLYLTYDLAVSVALMASGWPIHSHAYFWACLFADVGSAVLQIACTLSLSSGAPSRPWGVALGVGAFLWSMTLTPEGWSVAGRGLLLERQAVAYGCFGALLAAHTDGRGSLPVLIYYAVRVARFVAEQIAVSADAVSLVNVAALFAVSALFVAWGTWQIFPKRGVN